MAVGEANTGKTTLLKALFEPDTEPIIGDARPAPPKTVQVVPRQVSIAEHGVSFTLNIIDTPGEGVILLKNVHTHGPSNCIGAMNHLNEKVR